MRLADDVGWSAKKTADGGGEDASVVTSGKTLKLSNSPWAHRGEPLEIDNLLGDDTRDELVSFLDHVRRGDPATICDAREGRREGARDRCRLRRKGALSDARRRRRITFKPLQVRA